MLRRSLSRCFFTQQTIPIVPQGVLPSTEESSSSSSNNKLLVGYLLTRQPSVQHTLHPLEQELGFVLDREHARYCRHQQSSQGPTDAESATAFFSSRGLSLDSWNRHDKTQIQRDFFNLEPYREATGVTMERYEPARRVTAADFFDPFAEGLAHGPPLRHSVQRRLDETLLLIVKDGKTNKWTVPSRPVGDGATEETGGKFSLRTAVENAVLADHSKGIDAYIFGNAPQGVLQWSSTEAAAEGKSSNSNNTTALERGAPREEAGQQLFIYVASYLTGRPNFAAVEHRRPDEVSDHAWVTRMELADYEFEHPDMFALLQDITLDTAVRS